MDHTYLAFEDTYRTPIRIVRDGDTVWLHIDETEDYPNASPHLSVDQCLAVTVALTLFLRDVGHDAQPPEPVEPGVTERGFATFGEFTDLEGEGVRCQESSAVGAPRCWIFSGANAGGPSPHPHLDATMAVRLFLQLWAFINDASDPSHWRNQPDYIATWGAD